MGRGGRPRLGGSWVHLQVSVPVEFQAAGVEPTQCPMPHPIAGAPYPQPDLPVGHCCAFPGRQFSSQPQKAAWVRAGQGLGQSALSTAGGRSGGLLGPPGSGSWPPTPGFQSPPANPASTGWAGARRGVCLGGASRNLPPALPKHPGKEGIYRAYAAWETLGFWEPSEGAGPAHYLPLLQERPPA